MSGIAAIFITGFFIFNTLMDKNIEIKYSPSHIDYSITRGGNNYIKIENLLSKGNYQEAMKEIAREENAIAKQEIATDSIIDDEQREYEIKVYAIDMEILCWLKINALIGIGKHDEALLLLNKLRAEDGIFREKAEDAEFLYWYSIQGKGRQDVMESQSWIDKKHLEYWDACIDNDWQSV